ncbi:MAG: phage integrase SAM-like domain-containing protein [Ruminococcus sp.]|nr:phage integrase SAM-like domain-containing protein [Ruminococcus sp.]MDO4893673.1 phage integrase SAM-like domain-containing protein [Eubacteriales bacterium]
MNTRKEKKISEVWKEFITSQTAKGISDATIRKYHQVLHNISKYFDIDMPLDSLTKSKLEEMVVEMRTAGLAHNSIATYVRVVKTFLNWCRAENIVSVDVPNIKEKEG